MVDFNLKIKEGWKGYAPVYYLQVDSKKTWCHQQGGQKPLGNPKILLEIDRVKKGVVINDWSQEKHAETFYKWSEPKDAKLVNLSSPHLELLRQVIIQEEQEQAKEKVLLTERKKERMKKIKEHNQKAEYVIVDIKGKWTAEYDGTLMVIDTIRAIRNKKTGEIIASKSNYLGCNVFRINKARDKILRIVKKQGTINKIVGIKDFSRLLNNSEYRSKTLEINV